MKLSICIPVYQQKVQTLVYTLLQQANELSVDFEILLYDDYSHPEIKAANQPLGKLNKVIYREMTANLGRSKIRNRLAETASGHFMLFLDNDGEIFSPDFLKDYWQAKVEHGVACGGTSYPVKAPIGCELHFLYGYHREAKNAMIRTKAGHRGFKSNSFLIHKSVFESIQFDESLHQYGHEDTLFGLQLFKHQIPIQHIDNPILHNQLEENAEFIVKTHLGLQNLHSIAQKQNEAELDFFPMYQLALKIKKTGLHHALRALFKYSHSHKLKNLISSKPSLRIFDVYRLCYLLNLMK